MQKTPFLDNIYRSPERHIPYLSRKFPSTLFWIKALWIIWRASRTAKRGKYDSKQWIKDSIAFTRTLESVGIKIQIENLDVLRKLDRPCVFIANHMSTLETFVLPCLIAPFVDVTFVVKKQLVECLFFKHVMRSRNPVVVGRNNPRDDFKVVIAEGKKNLERNISVIVFPQTTRTSNFDPQQFNTIGIKLAKHAGVPVVPIALRTDAWDNGKLIKDLGRISPNKIVHFRFHEPIHITGNGKQEHQQITDFITAQLANWQKQED